MKICLEICILINYMLLQCFVIALKKDIQRVKLVHFQLCCEVHLDGLPSDSHLHFKVKICPAILHSTSPINPDMLQSCCCFSPY